VPGLGVLLTEPTTGCHNEVLKKYWFWEVLVREKYGKNPSSPIFISSNRPDPVKNAEFGDFGAINFRIIDYPGFYEKQTMLSARKSALLDPFGLRLIR